MIFLRHLYKVKEFAEFVKIEHTLFALPFAYLGAWIAQRGFFCLKLFILIALAFTGMRTASMTLNRIIDRDIDALNPRTANRHLPSGRISLREAYTILLLSLIVYFTSAYFINETVFILSPIPVIIAYIYPYLKRYTCLCHYVLGLILSLAPLGGWIAVKNSLNLDFTIVSIALAVIFWVAGFDIIYGLQDVEFDRKYGLHSIGACFGINFALRLSLLNHLIFFIFISISAILWSKYTIAGLTFIALLIAYEHVSVRRGNIETAFFKVNAVISSVMLLTFLLTT